MIIAIIPVKNEEWILRRNLATLSLFCDYIIVGLDSCADTSEEICDSFSKVIKVFIQDGTLNHLKKNRRQLLLERARLISDSAVIIAVDADEIFSSNILSLDVLKNINHLKPGYGLSVRFRELWFSPYLYRGEDSSSWSGRQMPCIWRDNGDDYPIGNRHEVRIPNTIKVEKIELDLIHFARVVPVNYWARMRNYIVHEVAVLHQNPNKINMFYSIVRDEKDMKLSIVPVSWYENWIDNDCSFLKFEDKFDNWFNDSTLNLILESNIGMLDKCDIWDFDWVGYYKYKYKEDPSDINMLKLNPKISKIDLYVSRKIRVHMRYPIFVKEYWTKLIVIVLVKFNLYTKVHKFFKK